MTVWLLVTMDAGRKSALGKSSVLIFPGMRKAREEVAKRRVVDSNMIAVWQDMNSVWYLLLRMNRWSVEVEVEVEGVLNVKKRRRTFGMFVT